MSTERVCLTLIAARSLRDELFDYLSEQRDLVPGFTASDAAGHGPTSDCRHRPSRSRGTPTSSWCGQFFRRKRPRSSWNGSRWHSRDREWFIGSCPYRNSAGSISPIDEPIVRRLQSAATAAIIGLLWPGAVQAETFNRPNYSPAPFVALTSGAGNESRIARLQDREEPADGHLLAVFESLNVDNARVELFVDPTQR